MLLGVLSTGTAASSENNWLLLKKGGSGPFGISPVLPCYTEEHLVTLSCVKAELREPSQNLFIFSNRQFQ